MTLLYFSVLLSILIITLTIGALIHNKILRRKGILPQKGEATMDDVKKLLSSGKKTLALGLYREIHGVSLKVAKKEIEELKINL